MFTKWSGMRGDVVLETHMRSVAARKWRTGVVYAGRYGAIYGPAPTTATKDYGLPAIQAVRRRGSTRGATLR